MTLPSGYQEVEYIESSGTQYIDTGVFASNNLQVETKVLIPNYSTIGPFFGCILSGWQNAGGNYFHCTPFNSKFYCGVNNSEVNGGTTAANQEYTIIFNNTSGYLNVNGSNVVSVSGTVGYTGTTIGISGRGGIDGTTYGRFGYNRYYYFNIYNKTTGEYIREMIPCYRKSDDEIGLYDLVNDTFYTNQGTGTFTKGPNVEPPVPTYKLHGAIQTFHYQFEVPYSWEPDASRTLLYLPLESNATDYSGNNRTCTPTSVTYTTVGGVPSAHVGITGGIAVTPTGFIDHNTPYMTVSVLCYVTSATSTSNRDIFERALQNKMHSYMILARSSHGTYPNKYLSNGDCDGGTIVANKWINIVATATPTECKIYINGELTSTKTNSSGYPRGNWIDSYQQSQTLLNSRNGVSDTQALNGNAREIIFENILWSDEDVSKYYQRIKAKLGL